MSQPRRSARNGSATAAGSSSQKLVSIGDRGSALQVSPILSSRTGHPALRSSHSVRLDYGCHFVWPRPSGSLEADSSSQPSRLEVLSQKPMSDFRQHSCARNEYTIQSHRITKATNSLDVFGSLLRQESLPVRSILKLHCPCLHVDDRLPFESAIPQPGSPRVFLCILGVYL